MRYAVLAYLVSVNLALLILMGRDKTAAAKGEWRAPEATLLSLAVLGGSAGGLLGMLCFRHKTRKPAFSLGFPVLFLVQAALAGLCLWRISH